MEELKGHDNEYEYLIREIVRLYFKRNFNIVTMFNGVDILFG